MSRLKQGEREFVTDFGDVPPTTPAGLSPQPAHGAASEIQEIDARGVSPPLPLLRAHRALRGLQPGQELRVITSYSQSIAEFQALAKHVTSYELVSQEEIGDEFVHLLKRRR